MLLLTTTGWKLTVLRVAPLVAFRIDGKLLIVAGNGGADVNPASVRDLRADPRARVQLGINSVNVVAHELHPSEREAIIAKINATVPAFAFTNYQYGKQRAPSRYSSCCGWTGGGAGTVTAISAPGQ